MELKKNNQLKNEKSKMSEETRMFIWILVSITACILAYIFLPYVEMSFIYNEF